MASSCRRPEHSAPPEVVSNLVYLKWLLLVNAKAGAICFGGVCVGGVFKDICLDMPPLFLQSI